MAIGLLRVGRVPFEEGVKSCLDGLEVAGRAERTLKEYGFVAESWKRFFVGRPLSSVTPEEVQRYCKGRRTLRSKKGKTRKASARTLDLDLTVLRSFFRWARKRGLVETDPTENLSRWKEPHHEPRVFMAEELPVLLRAAKEEYRVEALT